MSPPLLKVAVIGAGVAGLATARSLKLEQHQVVIYEKSGQLGGTWVYDPRTESDPLGLDPNREIIHGSMYPSLRANLPRQLMGFSDYPFSSKIRNDEFRTFPSHEEVLQFLIGFAEEFGLVDLIRFESEVVRVERVGLRNDEWVVGLRTQGRSSEEIFDAVVVCNGHNTQPRLAHLPGIERWPGKQIHSHNYRGPEPFTDQIVVVIGYGPSAIDISLEISKVAKEVYVSSRDPGIKISKLDFVDNIWQHSKIDCVNENGEVAFQDGASIHANIILYCTGFNFHFPFLKSDGIVSVDDNRVGPLYKHVFPPKLAPNLSFVGITNRAFAAFVAIDLQAKWIAKVLSGKANLPPEEEMMAEIEQYYQHLKEKGIPKHHTHSLGPQLDEYLDWLASEAGLAEVDEEIKLISKSYFNFVIDKGLWRAREWEL
ncbi:hypothetical protein BUALT_Bualt01G0207400 [Buddleja alternifolia]|uniref:Flavin-containing monooxygenase n=1 Tax=Buddleja alternifolia TaxID=168488 RepID=A0AAV6Y8X1_9LAMI|nr:hypothetical protein BUALT_Bualt01G0207400 [Buddleja alternifolia]